MLAPAGAVPRPVPRRSPTRRRLVAFVVAVPLLAVGAARLGVAPESAAAAVRPVTGYDGASVDGWVSHYGSYDLGPLGVGWCIDHGIRAPDIDLAYQRSALDDLDPEVRTGLAWLVGRHGGGADRVTSAAIMLVGHDLVDAVYPSGPLDVDRLGADRLAGFGPDADAVIERARTLKAEALARSHLRGPLRLEADLDADITVVAAAGPGPTPATIVARVLDADGRPVPDVVVRLQPDRAPADDDDREVAHAAPAPPIDETATTGPDGVARITVPGAMVERRVALSATVPDLALAAFAPTTGRAQRVMVAATTEVAANLEVPAPPGALVVRKRGDAEPAVPVAGARFEVHRVHDETSTTPALVGEEALAVGPDGTTTPVELAAGRYLVIEVAPPTGYTAAGPWEVTVTPGATVEVVADNLAVRGALRIAKIDAATGDALPGARLTVARDTDGDGDGDAEVAIVESTTEPTTIDNLLPGRYLVREATAPPGYEPLDEPLSIEVAAAATVEVVVPNTRTVEAPPPLHPRPPHPPPPRPRRRPRPPRPPHPRPRARPHRPRRPRPVHRRPRLRPSVCRVPRRRPPPHRPRRSRSRSPARQHRRHQPPCLAPASTLSAPRVSAAVSVCSASPPAARDGGVRWPSTGPVTGGDRVAPPPPRSGHHRVAAGRRPRIPASWAPTHRGGDRRRPSGAGYSWRSGSGPSTSAH